MSTNPQISNLTDIRHGHLADKLGEIRARENELKKQRQEIEAQLKEEGVEVAEGGTFRVTISYDILSKRVDWKTVAAKLAPSRQLVAAHTKAIHSDRVTVKALSK